MITVEQRVGLKKINKCAVQMSWCYSSVGILRALFMASDFTDNIELKQFVIKEFKKIVKMDMDDYLLSQPIICHGYAGTAAVFHSMYLSTNDIEFLSKAIEMLKISVQFTPSEFLDYINSINQNVELSGKAQLHEYLEGYSGILQTLLSVVMEVSSENEKRLLII